MFAASDMAIVRKPDLPNERRGMAYNGFISYSHAADGRLAPALQSALHHMARPWYKLRALRIFRDQTSLSASPGLWPSIEAALAASEYFILLASPAAVDSPWVCKEVQWWIDHRPIDRMLIVLTEGTIAWDNNNGDFDWHRTNALPRSLARQYASEPLYVDLAWARGRDQLSKGHSRFRAAVLDLAAPLHHRDKDELDGDDVRENRRSKRLAWGAVAILAILFASALVAAVFAVKQSRIADERRQVAEERLAEALLSRATELSRAGRMDKARELFQSALAQHEIAGLDPLPVVLGLWGLYYQTPTPLMVRSPPQRDEFYRLFFLGIDGADSNALVMTQLNHPALDDPGGEPSQLFEMDLLTGRFAHVTDGGSMDVLALARDRAPDGVSNLDRESQQFKLPHDLDLVAKRSPDRIVLTPADGSVALHLKQEERFFYVADLSPDGLLIATGAPAGDLRIWDAATGKQLARYNTPLAIQAIRFTPESRRVDVFTFRRNPGSSKDIAARFRIDLITGKQAGPMDLIKSDGHFEELAVSPDGRTAMTWTGGRQYDLWEFEDGRTNRRTLNPTLPEAAPTTRPGPDDKLQKLAFSPGGRYASARGIFGKVSVWEVASGRLIFQSASLKGIDPDVGPFAEDLLLADDGWLALRWSNGKLRVDRIGGAGAHGNQTFVDSTSPACGEITGNVVLAPMDGAFFQTGRERLSLRRTDDCSELVSVDLQATGIFDVLALSPQLFVRQSRTGILLQLERATGMLAWEAKLPALFEQLQKAPQDTEALTRLGEWYAFRRQWDRAQKAFARAQAAGATAIPSLLMAQAASQTDHPAAARDAFLAAGRADPRLDAYVAVWLRALQTEKNNDGN